MYRKENKEWVVYLLFAYLLQRMKHADAVPAQTLARSVVLLRSPLRYVTLSFAVNLRASCFHIRVGSCGTNSTCIRCETN